MKKPVSKIGTTLIIIATVILAGIAIFTAYRLYQLRQQSVAPNVPSSNPKAEEGTNACAPVTFTISLITPTATATSTGESTETPTETPTATPTPTPTSAPVLSCNNACSSNTDCPSDLICSSGYCRHPDCVGQSGCVCPTPTGTSTAVATPTSPGATAAPTEAALPVSGTSWPTLMGAGLGILVVFGAILLAL